MRPADSPEPTCQQGEVVMPDQPDEFPKSPSGTRMNGGRRSRRVTPPPLHRPSFRPVWTQKRPINTVSLPWFGQRRAVTSMSW